ncbi:MAG TPA: hypothetical protein VD866_29110 [Urbifossiella sp.]|nr:hypothetical protein [Urbifossiella sp.]
MRTWCWAAAVAVAGWFPGVAAAQPVKAVEPTVEVRFRSVNDLFDKAGYLGGLFDQEDGVTQVRELVKLLSQDKKGILGVDPARPIGAYGILTADAGNSPAVLMVPIADRAQFVRELKDRAGIELTDAGKGIQKAFIPILNEAYFTFADDYLFAARDPKHLDAKLRVSPKAFFDKADGSVASVVARFDRVPADLRDLVTGQLEHQLKEKQRADAGGKRPAELKLEGFVFDNLVGSAKAVVDEGRELSVRVFVDEKKDEVSAVLSLDARPGTGLAKTIAGLGGKKSAPAAIVKTADPVISATGKLALTDDMRKQFEPVLKALFEDAAANSGDRATTERFLEALLPTAKAASLDAAVSLTGPDAKGKHTLLAAVAVKEGGEFVKLAKEFAGFIPGEAATVTFDVEKVGAFSLHKVELGQVDAGYDRVFGSKTFWLATSDDVFAVGIEQDGKALKAGLKAAPVAVPVASASAALTRAVPLFANNLRPDEVKALVRDAFGAAGPAGRDTVTLTVDGGDRLTARLVVKGGAVKFGRAVDAFNKK